MRKLRIVPKLFSLTFKTLKNIRNPTVHGHWGFQINNPWSWWEEGVGNSSAERPHCKSDVKLCNTIDFFWLKAFFRCGIVSGAQCANFDFVLIIFFVFFVGFKISWKKAYGDFSRIPWKFPSRCNKSRSRCYWKCAFTRLNQFPRLRFVAFSVAFIFLVSFECPATFWVYFQ